MISILWGLMGCIKYLEGLVRKDIGFGIVKVERDQLM